MDPLDPVNRWAKLVDPLIEIITFLVKSRNDKGLSRRVKKKIIDDVLKFCC